MAEQATRRRRPGMLTRYVGGLLGEDVENMSDEQLRRFQSEALINAIGGLGSGVGLLGGIGQLAQRRQATEEKRKGEVARQDVMQAAANLAARATGRAGDVGEQTQLEEVRPMSRMNVAVWLVPAPTSISYGCSRAQPLSLQYCCRRSMIS